MERKMFTILMIGFICTGQSATIRLPTFSNFPPSIGAFLSSITNTTLGVVRGGWNMVSGSILRIVNRAAPVTEKIIALLEEFRKRMQLGIPELGIPILEPLTIERIDLNITHEIGNIRGNVENIEVRHLSKFKIDHVNFNPQNKLTLNITFPYLEIIGKYDVNGSIGGMFNIFGKGPFWLKFSDFKVDSISQWRYDPIADPAYYVEWMKLNITLKEIRNKFYNLMNDKQLEDIFNKAATQLAPEAINTLWPQIEPSVSKEVVEIINNKLKDFNLGNILGRLFNVFSIKPGRLKIHT